MYRAEGGEKARSSIQYALGPQETSFEDDDLLFLIKGAPDILLPNCSSALNSDGSVVPIDEDIRGLISQLQEHWASTGGQRVLLLARKIIKADSEDIKMGFNHALFGNAMMKESEKDLTCVGLVGIVVSKIN